MTDFAKIIPTEPQATSCEVHTYRPALYLAVGCLGWFLFIFVSFYPPMAIWVAIKTWSDPPWMAQPCKLTPQGGWDCP